MLNVTNVTSVLSNSLYIREVKEQDGNVKKSAQQRLLKSSDMSSRIAWQKYNAAIAVYAETLHVYYAETSNGEALSISNNQLVQGLQSIFNILALQGVRKDGDAYKANNYHVRYILRHSSAHDKKIVDGEAVKGEKLVSLTALRTNIEYALNRAINGLQMPITAMTNKQVEQINKNKKRGEEIAKAEREVAETISKAEASAKAAKELEAAIKAEEKAAKADKKIT